MAESEFTTEELEQEEWRSLLGFAMYEISSLGRVKSFKRKCPILLSQEINTCGYLRVGLTVNNKQRKHLTHRLVARMFLGDAAARMAVDHIDGCKTNNRISNLQYVTNKENQRRAVKLGLIKTGDEHYSQKMPERVQRGENHWSKRLPEKLASMARGIKHPYAKLNDHKVRQIRIRVSNGESMLSIAKELGLNHKTVWAIIQRKTWKHVP